MLLCLPSVVEWTFLTYFLCLRGHALPWIHRQRTWRSSSLGAASPPRLRPAPRGSNFRGMGGFIVDKSLSLFFMDEQTFMKLLCIDGGTFMKPFMHFGYRYVSRCSCSISPSRIEARSPHVGTIVKNAALFFTVGGVKYSLPFPSPFS